MAIMRTLFAASVLASLVSAIPMAAMERRAENINTVTHTTWVTVDETTTVWVDGTESTPPPAAQATTEAVATSAPAPAPVAAAPSAAVSPGNFAQQSVAPVAAAPSVPVASVAAPPASSAAQPQATSDVTPKSSSGGPCEGQGSGCSGDITFYNGNGGYGSCGSIIDDSANTIALPIAMMGEQSNGNPYCGRTVSIKGTDGTIHTATVADKCGGCTGDSIDLTPALFQAVAPSGDGRVHDISWWFN